LKQNLFGLGDLRIRDATVVDGTDGLALYVVKVSHALGATIVGDDIKRVAFPIPFGDLVAFSFCVTSYFKNSFVWALWKAGTAINALFCDSN